MIVYPESNCRLVRQDGLRVWSTSLCLLLTAHPKVDRYVRLFAPTLPGKKRIAGTAALVQCFCDQCSETIAFADATTFATALHVLGTAGQWRRCLEILQQMQGPDLMASMAVFHAAHVASASLLCWALRSAMVQAFKHPLADVAGSRVRRRLRVEATMQLGKLESCVCAWQGGRMTHRRFMPATIFGGRHQLLDAALAQLGGEFPSQADRLRHPHLEAFLLLPPLAARHLAEAKHLWVSWPAARLSRLVTGVADAQKRM
eukprot:s2868_g10.t2